MVYGFLRTASVSRPPSSYPTYLEYGEKEEEDERKKGERR
jgi:hypothetical protein